MRRIKKSRIDSFKISRLITLIILAGWILTACSYSPLHNALRAGNLQDAHHYIAERKGIDEPNLLGYRPLHVACDKEHVEIVKALVAQGVTIDPKNPRNGWTPLMIAVFHGNLRICEILVENGADVNNRNMLGETPIFIAAYKGKEKVFEYLIAKKASIEVYANNEYSPLMACAKSGNIYIAERLVFWGADLNYMTSKTKHDALMVAITSGHTDLATYLVKSGSNVNSRDVNGLSPLLFALKDGKKDFIHMLIAHGADIHAKSNAGNNSLLTAVFFGHNDLAIELINSGVQPIAVPEGTPDQIYASASLYKLLAELRDKEGNNAEASTHYLSASNYYEKAGIAYEKSADQMNKDFWKATFGNALVAGIASYQTQQMPYMPQSYQQGQQVNTGQYLHMKQIYLDKAKKCRLMSDESYFPHLLNEHSGYFS